jgi:response regulator RpfG family c-di-GMP phosphodiesterase
VQPAEWQDLIQHAFKFTFWTTTHDTPFRVRTIQGALVNDGQLSPDLVGKTVEELDTTGRILKAHHDALRSQQDFDYKANGQTFRIHLIHVPTKKLIAGVAYDVSHRTAIEQMLRQSRQEIVLRVGRILQYAAGETEHHTERVGLYSQVIGHKLGMSEGEAQILRLAAALHDVGKVHNSLRGILLKQGPLEFWERTAIQEHSQIGRDILSGSDTPVLMMGEDIAWTHHERWDGAGYPRGLKGDQISMHGRVCAIADMFDALVTPRPYRSTPIRFDRALEMVISERGKALCPEGIDAFQDALGDILRILHDHADEPPVKP